jgi:hypothetical protein
MPTNSKKIEQPDDYFFIDELMKAMGYHRVATDGEGTDNEIMHYDVVPSEEEPEMKDKKNMLKDDKAELAKMGKKKFIEHEKRDIAIAKSIDKKKKK